MGGSSDLDLRASLRHDARAIVAAALDAVDARAAVRNRIRTDQGSLMVAGESFRLASSGSVYVAALGKAALAMARGAADALGDRLDRAVVAAPVGGSLTDTDVVSVIRGGHPLPDLGSLRAGEALLELAAGADEGDLVLFLVSGGASAIAEAFTPGVALGDMQEAIGTMLAGGADIHELNAFRRRRSRLKAGGLLHRALPAQVVTLAISDVLGDDPHVIGSGPTYDGSAAAPFEIVLTVDDAIAGAVERARALGYEVSTEETRLSGEASEAGAQWGATLRGTVPELPQCRITGGETVVTVRGDGLGGRSQEFALAAALAMGNAPGAIAAVGTDGRDGPTGAAGAIVDSTTTARGVAMGRAPSRYLDANDSYTFLAGVGDLIWTGATGTNVMDVAIALTGARDG